MPARNIRRPRPGWSNLFPWHHTATTWAFSMLSVPLCLTEMRPCPLQGFNLASERTHNLSHGPMPDRVARLAP